MENKEIKIPTISVIGGIGQGKTSLIEALWKDSSVMKSDNGVVYYSVRESIPGRGNMDFQIKELPSIVYSLQKELVLRVNNIIKRAYRDDNNRISIDGYELDEEQRKIYADNVEIELTTKEFDLLMMFIKNKGIAFSRDKILENVWDENYFGSDRVVDDTLRRLRKKLPNLNIHTIYGYGYRLG